MQHNHPHYETMQAVNRQLHKMWVNWGLIPNGIALILLIAMSVVRRSVEVQQPEQLALGFKAVMALGGALFLLGFWLDGHWTEAQHVARIIWAAAGGRNGLQPTKSQLADRANMAMGSLMLSTKALTIVGLLIGLAAVLAALAGLKFGYSIQMLCLALAFQLFIYSRHPYYRELMEAAVRGDLVVEEKGKK